MADVEKGERHDVGSESGAPPRYGSPTYGTTEPTPPSYDQYHSSDTALAEPPPSYDSIFGQVRAVKAESSGTLDFFKKLLILLLGTIGCTIFVAIFLAIPVSMIAIGSIYLHKCPCEGYIPIYLIVGGCFGVVKNLSNMAQRIKNKHEDNDEDNARTNPFDGILNCFLFGWFITGNVWIYSNYGKFTTEMSDPLPVTYCDPTLYWFAFWLTTSTYIIAVLGCCCVCITGCAVNIVSSS
jgi:hypothetical protein